MGWGEAGMLPSKMTSITALHAGMWRSRYAQRQTSSVAACNNVMKQHGLACRHVETILCSRLRKGPMLDPYKRRIMKMPDGGSVALDFEDLDSSQDLPSDAPVVILLPGKRPSAWTVSAGLLQGDKTVLPLNFPWQ